MKMQPILHQAFFFLCGQTWFQVADKSIMSQLSAFSSLCQSKALPLTLLKLATQDALLRWLVWIRGKKKKQSTLFSFHDFPYYSWWIMKKVDERGWNQGITLPPRSCTSHNHQKTKPLMANYTPHTFVPSQCQWKRQSCGSSCYCHWWPEQEINCCYVK